jgi:hypothetical protein
LFCCPGIRPHVDDYQVNHLLWMNKDGTMRRKEVLNNGEWTVMSRVIVCVYVCVYV